MLEDEGKVNLYLVLLVKVLIVIGRLKEHENIKQPQNVIMRRSKK